jgi:pimeloyl-ACP methyl ester carboxylesterase
MKKIMIISILLLQTVSTSAQTITGKLVDQNGNDLSDLQLQLYINPNVYNTTSGADGSFAFTDLTSVEGHQESLPTGYAVSNNFPNPFNPTTRIGITLPQSGKVKIAVYNVLGQKVMEEKERQFNAGYNYIDLELNGLSNGFYIARIAIDDKYTVTKKLMLVYGTQHLNAPSISSSVNTTSNSLQLNKLSETSIDSIVVTGSTIFGQVFKNLPTMQGSSLDIGNMIVTNIKVEKSIDKAIGGTLTTPEGAVLSIPPNALPASGNVYFGTSGREPTSVSNQNLQIFGNSFTLGLPADSLLNPIQLSFPKPTISVPLENYCLFLYNGNTYYPIEYAINGDTITAIIDKINWETSRGLNKRQILGEIFIFNLILKQTPPAAEMGLKEVTISSGDLEYSTPTANANSKILLLIHGWISRPNVWKTIIQKIKLETNPAYTNIWTFGYNSSWSINTNAHLLAQALSQHLNGAKVDIVAHSMGGLISRSMIEQNNGAQYVNKLITLGTPHQGSPLAAIRGLLGSMVTFESGITGYIIYNYFTQGFRDLDINSTYIQQMKTLSQPMIPYYAIASTNNPSLCHWSTDDILPGPDDGVVTEVSAHGVPGAIFPTSVNIPVALAHIQMTENDLVYSQILMYLRTDTIYVSTTGADNNPGTKDLPFKTIQVAIDSAVKSAKTNGGVIICVAQSTYVPGNGLNNSGNGILINNSNIKLSGGWDSKFKTQVGYSILNGANSLNVMKVNNVKNITIDKFEITNGYSSNSGGGIYFYNVSNSKITNSKITNNSAENEGGGVCIFGGTNNSIDNTAVNGNIVKDVNSGRGGGICIDNSINDTINATINGNNCKCEGGGLAICGGQNIIISKTSTISNNNANGGGGITLWETSNNMIYGTINGNSSGDWGGGIHLCNSSNNTINAVITNNKGIGNANWNYMHGGGISFQGSSNNKVYDTVSNNMLIDGDGTGFYQGAGIDIWDSNNNEINATIINNSFLIAGGLLGASIEGSDGGGISIGGDNNVISGKISDNSAYEGGGVYIHHGKNNSISATIIGNGASFGGGVCIKTGSDYLTNIINGTVSGNIGSGTFSDKCMSGDINSVLYLNWGNCP